MLSLRKRSDFLRIKDQGNIIHVNHWLSVAYLKRSEDQHRFGWTVSSAVGNAVLRNRFKRWVREILRERQSKYPRGYDFHFIFRRREQSFYKDLSRQDMEAVFAMAEQKLGRLGVRAN